MQSQYHCTNSIRRTLVRDARGGDGRPLVNGIDYVEVDEADQQKLLLYFIHPLPGQANGVPVAPPLNLDNFVILGGVRVTNIVIGMLEAADNRLTLTVERAGDFSTYRLRLIAPAADDGAPPPGFDPQLAEVSFSFKVNCPSEFDCAPVDFCPDPQLPAPAINYLAKDYASFRRQLLDRLAVIMPDWRERNPADPTLAVLETLAYVGDYLSYTQDAVATEAYLGTARQRASVRRHARLVDYAMHDGCNARTWVTFTVEEDHDGTPDKPILAAHRAITARAEPSLIFELLHPVESLKAARSQIDFYTWDDPDCCLPKGATRAYLAGSAADLTLTKGDLLIFEEILGAESGRREDADPTHRHPVRLSAKPQEQIDPLTQTPVLAIEWHAEDALPFALCLRHFPNPVDSKKPLVAAVARGNIALADHGVTVSKEAAANNLIPAAVPADRAYRPRLVATGLTQAMPYQDSVARTKAAAAALQCDLRQVLPWVKLRSPGLTWHPRRDLLNSGRFAPEFVVEMTETGEASLRFGDDTLGRRPAAGTAFQLAYRVGNGPTGNIGADMLDLLVVPTENDQPVQFNDQLAEVNNKKIGVRNPLPASGGTAPETMDQVRLYAPQAFRYQERAVTAADYAAAAERYPGVQRAVATRRWTGSWYTFFITVDRQDGQPVTTEFERALRRWLDRFRLAGYDLEIDGPRYVALDIALTVCVAPGYYQSSVKKALLDRFSRRALPDGRRGFFHPDNFTFGQPVYLSQIIAAAMQTPGVQWVDAAEGPAKPNHFRRWGHPSYGEAAAGRINLGRLEIARLDNDPNMPERGKLEFLMGGGR